ncbi:hypothetical protein ASE23_26215 [Rhizobium sp. Root73]|nr:hypothetical protein ASD36_25680 [Rhizobium sp. Root1334]KRC06423.1 hypothetical protein ASE23_26215 [Rhizobium sp. Root73]
MRRMQIVLVLCLMLGALAAPEAFAETTSHAPVKIGYVADQAPFSSRGPDGIPQGYAIDLCNRIAAGMSPAQPPEYVETTLADAFNAVAEHRIDLACGALTINLARRALVDFSQPIFLTGASALLRDDSPSDLRELFFGERPISPPRSPQMRAFATSLIGVHSGSTTEARLRQAIAEGAYSASVIDFSKHEEGLVALETRRIDAYFADRALLGDLLKKAQSSSDLIIGRRLLTHESYGIAMRRDDPELRLRVDRMLSEFYRSDEFAKLLQTYFGSEAPVIRTEILAQAIPD